MKRFAKYINEKLRINANSSSDSDFKRLQNLLYDYSLLNESPWSKPLWFWAFNNKENIKKDLKGLHKYFDEDEHILCMGLTVAFNDCETMIFDDDRWRDLRPNDIRGIAVIYRETPPSGMSAKAFDDCDSFLNYIGRGNIESANEIVNICIDTLTNHLENNK